MFTIKGWLRTDKRFLSFNTDDKVSAEETFSFFISLIANCFLDFL